MDHKFRTWKVNERITRYQNLYEAAEDCASAASNYASSATGAAADQYSAASSAIGDHASSAADAASSQYAAISSLISELVVGKEPAYTESVYSRFAGAYSLAASSASSFISAASETVASAASDATDFTESVVNAAGEKVKEGIDRARDEL